MGLGDNPLATVGQLGEGVVAAVEDREGPVQTHGVQDGADESRRRGEAERDTAIAGVTVGADEQTEAGRVDDVHPAQVDHDVPAHLGHVPQGRAQVLAGVQVDVTGGGDDCRAVEVVDAEDAAGAVVVARRVATGRGGQEAAVGAAVRPGGEGEPLQPCSATRVQTTSASGSTQAVPRMVSPQVSQIRVIRYSSGTTVMLLVLPRS